MHKVRTALAATAAISVAVVFVVPVRAATLSGTVRAGEGLKNPAPLDVSLDAWVCGHDGRTPDPRLRIGPRGGIANVVVTVVDAIDAPPYPRAGKPVIDQKGCVFVPHVLVVAPGQEIVVSNDDRVFHNVRSQEGENRTVNKGQPGGVAVRMKFARSENVHLGCDVHYWMSAVVVVAANAYTAVTDTSGAFRIDGLRPGSYPMNLWHETLGSLRTSVIVTEEGGRLDVAWPSPTTAKVPAHD